METLKSINIDRISTDFKKFPNTIFWFNQKGEYLAEYNWDQKKFWVSYRKIWQEYESDMKMQWADGIIHDLEHGDDGSEACT